MRTLVLNAGFEPLAIVSYKRAIVLVMNDKANILECDENAPVWSASDVFDRPAVIVLTRYVRVSMSREVPVTR
ncbi:MAG: HNH endonuclease, partial [Microbacterium gubbeenense]